MRKWRSGKRLWFARGLETRNCKIPGKSVPFPLSVFYSFLRWLCLKLSHSWLHMLVSYVRGPLGILLTSEPVSFPLDTVVFVRSVMAFTVSEIFALHVHVLLDTKGLKSLSLNKFVPTVAQSHEVKHWNFSTSPGISHGKPYTHISHSVLPVRWWAILTQASH